MIIHKELRGTIERKGLLDIFIPLALPGSNWKNWKAVFDLKTCEGCRSNHGKIYASTETPNPSPPLHPFCRCEIAPVWAVKAGMCSYEGKNGADWWIWNKGMLPDYYVYIQDLIALGWKYGKAPVKYAPDKMVFGGIYRNDDKHLPDAPGRIWFEADLNYYNGRRNGHRILWSNDGLMFVSYDHYSTFFEVIGG